MQTASNKYQTKLRYLIGTLLICLAFSCSDNQQHPVKKSLGLYIENGPRQGFKYFDSAGTEYRYRYTTTSITNDSIVPVRLTIKLPKECNHPCSDGSQKLRAFLLPRELTPEKQQFDDSMSRELKEFLSVNSETPVSLDKIINPKEKCVMTFGILTDIKCEDPSQITLLLNEHDQLSVLLRLDFLTFYHKGTPKCYLDIPSGQISFSNN
jgi:hypothetical protein